MPAKYMAIVDADQMECVPISFLLYPTNEANDSSEAIGSPLGCHLF
jgi:hypothetical protein